MDAYEQKPLNYGYGDLAPQISEEQLKIHYEKHHASYVKNANAILAKLDSARKEGLDIDMKSTIKSLSFNVGGHILHTLFWDNLRPKDDADAPSENLEQKIEEDFGSLDRMKYEFASAAASVEGSGWAALSYDPKSKKLLIDQIEKHNCNIYPSSQPLLVLDVWEHAFYLDYKNEKGQFIDAFWDIVCWREVSKRFEGL